MKSGYLGVHWHPEKQLWMIRMRFQGKQKTIGYRRCRHEAARVYNEHALSVKGQKAKLNTIAV